MNTYPHWHWHFSSGTPVPRFFPRIHPSSAWNTDNIQTPNMADHVMWAVFRDHTDVQKMFKVNAPWPGTKNHLATILLVYESVCSCSVADTMKSCLCVPSQYGGLLVYLQPHNQAEVSFSGTKRSGNRPGAFSLWAPSQNGWNIKGVIKQHVGFYLTCEWFR